jgi:hypothetical protein
MQAPLRAKLARWMCAVSTALAWACHGEADEARRAEAGRIARAVQTLRSAPNDAKRPPFAALKSEKCSFEDACTFQNTCVSAYQFELDALDSIAAVRREMDGPIVTPESAKVLAQAETGLTRAKELSKTCADLEGALRRRYRLQ